MLHDYNSYGKIRHNYNTTHKKSKPYQLASSYNNEILYAFNLTKSFAKYDAIKSAPALLKATRLSSIA